MNRKAKVFIFLFGIQMLVASLGVPVFADEGYDIIHNAIDVLHEINMVPERSIPPALLAGAQGIAVIPGAIKVGFIVGVRKGTGIFLVKNEAGEWENPDFVKFSGGGMGLQAGVQSTDIILVFKSKRNIDKIKLGEFTIGADAAVAAGPVGRQLQAGTDTNLQAEILSFSRSRGLFAGISLEGSSMKIDHELTEEFYGRPTSEINSPDFTPHKIVEAFKKTIITYSKKREKPTRKKK